MTASGEVVLKLATSLDGRIALANGASRWITGPEARAEVHRMRAWADAVLTGVGSVLADDPQMTARPDGTPAQRQPIRAVLDTTLRTPPQARIIRAAGTACILYGARSASGSAQGRALEAAGAVIALCPEDENGRPDVRLALDDLRARGARRILVEAGACVAASALRAGVAGRIEWFRAPMVLGGDAVAVVGALGLDSLQAAPRYRRRSVMEVGADLHETYIRAPAD